MKYHYRTEPVPQDRRKDLNDKVLYLIDNGIPPACGITPEDIYNAYTGTGGLHSLNRDDYDSYHSYSQAKKEIEKGQDQAGSPHELERLSDGASGTGVFYHFSLYYKYTMYFFS